MSGSSADPYGYVAGRLHTNPYALARYNENFDYNVAESTPRYPWPEMTAFAAPGLSNENGYADAPANSNAPRTRVGDASVYQLPQRGHPTYETHNDDGAGTRGDTNPSSTDVVSAQRIRFIPTYGKHNDEGPPGPFWAGQGLGGTPAKTRSVEGGEELDKVNRPTDPHPYTFGQRRWTDSPRRDPVPSLRPRGLESPDGWRFLRPFDQLNRGHEGAPGGTARRMTGVHFSMADHRRTYPIGGMVAPRSSRNTYRLEPQPWDEDHTDATPIYANPSRVNETQVASSKNSWRIY